MIKIKYFLVLLLLIVSSKTFSQDSATVNINADLVSRYMYRGQSTGGESSHVQPSLHLNYKNIEIGAWGSYGVSNNYNEIDLYGKYSISQFSIMFMHYYISNQGEITLAYKVSDKIPLSIFVATYVYGDIYNSTYVEIGYSLQLGTQPVDLFVGITPYKGMYDNNLNVVNMGATFKRNINVSDKLVIPAYITIGCNPQVKNTILVFGITI